MKLFGKTTLLSAFFASLFFTTPVSAGWVTEDGKPYTEDCCKTKKIKKVKRIKKATACATPSGICDYSKIPMAKIFQLKKGEKLRPALLGNCQGK